MSSVEVKTYKFICDRCRTTALVNDTLARLPAGWGYRKVYDCGMTGYTRTDELCPDCLAEESEE